MDLLLVLIIVSIIGLPKALRSDALGDKDASYVEQYDVPIGNNLQNLTEPDAFMLIIRRLGLM